jgi:hypothetical protein
MARIEADYGALHELLSQQMEAIEGFIERAIEVPATSLGMLFEPVERIERIERVSFSRIAATEASTTNRRESPSNGSILAH